jgi:hypothetical protein
MIHCRSTKNVETPLFGISAIEAAYAEAID